MKRLLTLALVLCVALLSIGVQAANKDTAEPIKLNLVSGPVTGGWYVGMGIIGKLIQAANPNIEITMLPGGVTVNPIRLERGQAELGLMQRAFGTTAREGQPPFKAPVKNISSVVCFNDVSPLNIMVREDLGVDTFKDIIDKKLPVRMGIGLKGGAGDILMRWLLNEYGVDYSDIEKWGGKVYFNNYDDMCNLAKDGLIDLIPWIGRGENWFMAEISNATKVKWLPVEDSVAENMVKKYGLTKAVVPAKLYGGKVGSDIPTVAEMTGVIAREDMPEELVYQITKAINEGHDELVQSFATWDSFVPEKAAQPMAYPYHPGAIRYYKEAGILK